jgi:ABC-type branched-subunit amino acid transport system ATPase component
MNPPLLDLRDVHAAYLQKEVLHGVSLSVYPGEMVALLGENGAGKSTVLKVVAGLLRPSRGAVNYRGRDLTRVSIEERPRLGIGYLMQGGRVFPNLTVQENYNLAASEAQKAGHELVPLGNWFPLLRDRRRDRAGLLSGGQRQMIAIELVLSQKPEFLLLDEPTGALTGELSLHLLEQIRRYVEGNAAAALLVEHTLEVTNFATNLLHLTNGAIAASNRS